MVRAWYMDNDTSDQRTEHHRNPPQFLALDELYKISGVEYFQINIDTYLSDGVLDGIKQERGYTFEDEITCSKECLPNYEEKLKNFFQEHLHTDEEIRFVLDGSGYFDVRDKNDEWIRIEVVPGDMIVIPSGIYHRFTLDIKNYIKAKRFFVGEPVWQPYNRPADDMDCRKEYLEKLATGDFKKYKFYRKYLYNDMTFTDKTYLVISKTLIVPIVAYCNKMRAWYMDVNFSHKPESHRHPPKFITAEELYKVSGVEYFKLNLDTYTTDGVLDKIKQDRGCTFEDEMICSKEYPDYDEKIKTFFQEHLHPDEEIRFFTDGSGYFDIRDKNDEWIRIEVVAGDLIILPGGIYHRFSLDLKKHVKVKRLFTENFIWTAYNRPADDMDCRKQYLERLESGKFS